MSIGGDIADEANERWVLKFKETLDQVLDSCYNDSNGEKTDIEVVEGIILKYKLHFNIK